MAFRPIPQNEQDHLAFIQRRLLLFNICCLLSFWKSLYYPFSAAKTTSKSLPHVGYASKAVTR